MKISKKQGFTLIELIITIAILAIVVTTFLGLFTQGFQAIAYGGVKTIDGLNFQQKAENIISYSILPSPTPTLPAGVIQSVSQLSITMNDSTVITVNGMTYSVSPSSINDSDRDLYVFIPQAPVH